MPNNEILMEDKTQIAEQVVKLLKENREISDKDHAEQHEFIKVFMKKEKRKQELWDKVKANVLTAVTVGSALFLLGLLWDDFLELVGKTS